MYWIILIGVLSSCLQVQAQQPCSWQLTTKDGLPSQEVYDLYQDSKGYMWIGTAKGLCKYNGVEFSYYKNKAQKRAAISGIQEDSKGRIWCRNFDGQFFYVEEDSLHYLDIIKGIGVREFIVTQDDKLCILNAAERVLYFFYKKENNWERTIFDWKQIKPKKDARYSRVDDIKENDRGDFYLLTGDGLYLLKDEVFRPIKNEGLLTSVYADIDSVLIAEGKLYSTKNKLYVLQYDPKGDKITTLENNELVVNDELKNRSYWEKHQLNFIRCHRDSTCWILTGTGGAVKIASEKVVSKQDSLVLYPQQGISDMLIDHEGNYWLSSLKNGIYIIPHLYLQQVTEANYNLPSGALGVLSKVDSQLLIAANQGEVLALNAQNCQIEQAYNVPLGECNSITGINNAIHIVGKGYHYRFRKKITKADEILAVDGVNMYNVCNYKDSLLIRLAKRGGLTLGYLTLENAHLFPKHFFPYAKFGTYFYKDRQEYFYSKTFGKKSFCLFNDDDHNRIIVGLEDTLMCYPERTYNYAILNEQGESISGRHIEKGSNGLIWVSTVNDGIYGLDEALKIKHHLTNQDGLLDNVITRFKLAEDGLWLLFNDGIQFFNPETKKSRIYTKQDGLPTHEIRDIELLDGKVWLSTAEGLVFFDETMPSRNTVAPLIFIKKISIHEKDRTLHSHYKLDYTQNALTVHVEGIAYRSRGSFQYKYRMLGIDSTWRYQESKINLFRYPQLQPGNYTFEILAVNEDGIESEKAIVLNFYIAAPYWQRWWFVLLVMVVVLGIVLTIVWGRLQQLKLKNQNSNLRMEALQSQMNPHFIFNVLTAVQNLWLQHKNELAMDLQSNFAKLLRKIFQYSSKRAIGIEQVEEFLNNYLRLEQIRFEDQVDISFEIEEELLEGGYLIPPLLIQPIIENSFKHGLFHKDSDRCLSIVFKKEANYLYVCIEDNGVGRKVKQTNSPKRTSGLSTTKERLEILQSSIIKESHRYNNIKITDLKTKEGIAKGTKVELWIPFVIN